MGLAVVYRLARCCQPAQVGSILASVSKKKEASLRRRALNNQGLFKGLPRVIVAALRKASEPRTLRGGETLLHQGEDAIALYYVQSGRFRVSIDGRRIASIGAGEAIGELAFLTGGKRTASVQATRDSVVLRLSREDYDRISLAHPQLNHSLLQLVSTRLATTNTQSGSSRPKPSRVIAVLPAGGGELPEKFVPRLAHAMDAILGQRLPVSTTSHAEQTSVDDAAYKQWLGTQEAMGGYVLVNASGPAHWCERACRNADTMMLVAKLDSQNTGLSQAEQACQQWSAHQSQVLVLLRDSLASPVSGSRRWLDKRGVDLHLHLAWNHEADFQRTARFLTGRALGLILAGGGALGCAHLGVIQAMREADIPIDIIGGASAGAAMGCAIASGLSPAETLDQMEDMFLKQGALRKLTLPVHSLLDPSVFDQQLKSRYGDEDITDLPINFFATSTNLSTNSLFIHRRGARWQAVRASGSLPTVLPPFIDANSNILVDGGVLDNAPVAVMHEIKSGPNIVVALKDQTKEWRPDATYSDLRKRGALLRDVFLRRKGKHEFPSLVDVMSRSMMISSRIASRETLSELDHVLRPPMLSGMRIFDWSLGRELAGLAQEYTQQQIDAGWFKPILHPD